MSQPSARACNKGFGVSTKRICRFRPFLTYSIVHSGLIVCEIDVKSTLPYDWDFALECSSTLSSEQTAGERAFYPKISIHLAVAGYWSALSVLLAFSGVFIWNNWSRRKENRYCFVVWLVRLPVNVCVSHWCAVLLLLPADDTVVCAFYRVVINTIFWWSCVYLVPHTAHSTYIDK